MIFDFLSLAKAFLRVFQVIYGTNKDETVRLSHFEERTTSTLHKSNLNFEETKVETIIWNNSSLHGEKQIDSSAAIQ